MNTTTLTSTNSNNVDNNDISGLTYVIAFVLAIIFVILTIVFACTRVHRAGLIRRQTTPHVVQDSVRTGEQTGLDENILHGFPKLLYSEVRKETGSSFSSCCSICLADYNETDMLRLLPDCGHIYHLSCVDSWLKLHSSCPICRNPPIRAPCSVLPSSTEEELSNKLCRRID
ncbi:RING-H2 finger protein [Quillaja saponaria]|uniref:RING-type E3 ubiquitin transferase n=1 Tax=Quillaja saponaria TaxID=32244 RepID=A0AAD7PX56_QUISA|nr:RING-H2 finger protein [Quillaja saponaria]